MYKVHVKMENLNVSLHSELYTDCRDHFKVLLSRDTFDLLAQKVRFNLTTEEKKQLLFDYRHHESNIIVDLSKKFVTIERTTLVSSYPLSDSNQIILSKDDSFLLLV